MAKKAAKRRPRTRRKPGPVARDVPYEVSTVRLEPGQWEWIRERAHARTAGTRLVRPDVSAVIRELVAGAMSGRERGMSNGGMQTVAERLRATAEAEVQSWTNQGRTWAEKTATVAQLRRLESYVEPGDPSSPEWHEEPEHSAFTAAECFAEAVLLGGKDRDRQEMTEAWERLGFNVYDMTPERLRGFADGALEVWDEVKDQI